MGRPLRLLAAKPIKGKRSPLIAHYGRPTGLSGHKLSWDEKKLNAAAVLLTARQATLNVAFYGHILILRAVNGFVFTNGTARVLRN
jgi:hypothetical protein